MDSAADSLLALSNAAPAINEEEEIDQDDDRSSSLSELDDEEGPDTADSDADADEDADGADQLSVVDGDSEAETERLEISPDKAPRKKSFGATPSKLAQTASLTERPEIESLTDSGSSLSSDDESDDLSDAPADEDEVPQSQFENRSPVKRKREADEEEDAEQQERSRRRRTGSIASDEAKSDPESDAEGLPTPPSREASAEPDAEVAVVEDPEAEDEEPEEEEDEDEQKVDSNEEIKEKPRGRVRSSRRLGKEETVPEEEADVDEEAEVDEQSDEVEVDDAEAAAKSEEEQAKRLAAMEALTHLERHFAVLRDRLYDERIAAINNDLAQLAESVPTHPELLKQLEVVRKHRDDKFEVEQKLLVYKIGALKNKSIAERSQIHSAYYQTVRDIREKHLERLSEHFYRIQRDRFKSETAMPSYVIPFPERRSKRITQQTAYNKEVSILSGVAKYVGFPAAPDLAQSHAKELEDDLQKMGVSHFYTPTESFTDRSQLSTHLRARPQRMTSVFGTVMAPSAEEQFLEKNPWANPQHPMHRLGITNQGLNSGLGESYLTPSHQQRIADLPVGSASTIVEHPSAPASSNFNTPHDPANNQNETLNGILNHRVHSISPLDTRRPAPEPEAEPQAEDRGQNSSPLTARIAHLSPSRAEPYSLGEIMASHSVKPAGITAGAGMGGRFLP
jgi:hypothetical protein